MTLSNPYDQDIQITDIERRFLQSIDEVLEQVNQDNAPDAAIDFIGNLRRNQQIQGLGLAKLLYGLYSQWDHMGIDGDFHDFVMAETGLSKQTIDKYRAVWQYIFTANLVPKNIQRDLMIKPIGNLILLVGFAREANDEGSIAAMTEEEKAKRYEQWKAIVAAPDRQSMQSLVRAFRGEQTSSKTSISIMVERDGQLRAKRGDNEFKAIGFLDVQSEEEVTSTAVDRIIKNSRIIER